MIEFEQNPGGSQLVYTPETGAVWIDYQLDFLVCYRPDWALETAVRLRNGKPQLVLALDGLEPLTTLDAGTGLSREQGLQRLQAVSDALGQAEDCLFPVGQILLEPEYIFFERPSGQVRLAVLPLAIPEGTGGWDAFLASLGQAYHLDAADLVSGIRLQADSVAGTQSGDIPGEVVQGRQPAPLPADERSRGRRTPGHGRPVPAGKLRPIWLYLKQVLKQFFYEAEPAPPPAADALDQTQMIHSTRFVYRLGMLSVGLPGSPEETEGLRAYILVDEFLIGRDSSVCDLALPAASVGRRHARITRQEGSFFITDLGSKNGTSLDGRRLNRHETYLLPDRCRIEFADQAFYFLAD